jgi:hypothetical protein
MSLEDPNVVDIISEEFGVPVLVITDSGVTAAPAERYRLLVGKLSTYGAAIVSDRFRQRFPGRSDQARIQVYCAAPPTSEMQAIDHITARDAAGRELRVPIQFRVFPA